MWSGGLLLAHVLCYVGMIASAVAGGAMLIYMILLLPLYLSCLGAGAGLAARQLYEWHLSGLPAHGAPTGPTYAEIEIARLIFGAKIALGISVVLGLGFFALMQEGWAIAMIPPAFSAASLWFAFAHIIRRTGVSRTEAKHQDAVHADRPGVRRERMRQNTRWIMFKRGLVCLVPFVIARWCVDIMAPGSDLVPVVNLLWICVTMGVVLLPIKPLPRYHAGPAAGLPEGLRMPRRRF
ncbi:hypothetical protein PSJ8397_00805 [Pseudooctadecabacter jejudonensis]|uniref:Uncharacterized protein n=2 Tax=Pseudooctadecabacter jejudonensis TaxID=1391910 RepID=A0A1Y5RMJ2_9RHOB|nr:hypothetical protein PSJ8397_00805 [Pseudooctadecabacter jejudonensis]